MARARRRKKQNRFGVLSISAVVLMLLVVISIKSIELNAKNEQYIQKEAQLLKERDAQLDRQKELEEYAKYVQTKKFIEEVAKEKLGLVYDDEIIFKEKN
ncbi:septum formation initiator family protein [Candidatus Galacturonibacter soehngenii]|uniref:Septum formation initiator family protein n=1 Tax=Candidatus Galacturonatibacter soehngenii TaxID=2307010 RepID=A0A7V7QIC0_9FIRM|nr:septum formation initiator family protein [Candidatus Galacturonibacter soehngenii]KAB1435883.1 septum formation initiator family protein [Candidatus Galacturonibacter soehngenii]MBA4686627.1 septum formation initiator family protein [Candidatus Galacturonibacter soehngenii]